MTLLTNATVTTAQDKQDKLAADKQNQINSEAQRYLADTDWYELRELRDSTKPVPQDVLDKRQASRDAII